MSKRKCGSCGSEMESDSGYWAEGYKRDVCWECYHEIVTDCTICGSSDVMPSDVSDFILVKAEFSRTGQRPPGIYRVLSYPFYISSMLGGGSICNYDIRFADKLPKPDSNYDISGHICNECCEPYAKTFKKVYGNKALAHGFDKAAWVLEREYARNVIIKNPDMMRDLECSRDDSYWEQIKDAFCLPNDIHTYHDWLFLKFKGVSIYCSYRHRGGWLTVNPDPKYRGGPRGDSQGIIFDASGLPGWKRIGKEYKYEHPIEDRRAVKLAIKSGILTQRGLNTDKK